MKISRLRLTGFKSFVEPTDVVIEPGLTGVVGPNGCGKSNLLEAIRWVMGESSPKSMRGQGMEDVIFAGAGPRPPRNSAEVLITLENSDRQAPSQFNDSDTIEVVRRIERDAGSLYRVNGRDVRQRDVQILFADASTGAQSPALVKQGQISELINMKPKSRRAILEEAAGISGLHSRRHEAELRLKAAETNLERLNDVIQEIESQLANLRKQARQATRYRNISGDIRRTEALALYLRWTAAQTQIAATEARLTEVVNELADATALVARLTSQREAQAGKLPEKREAQTRAAAALQRLAHEREMLGKEEERARQRARDLEARIAQMGADLDRERLNLRDAEESRGRLATEAGALAAEIDGREARRAASAELVRGISARLGAAEHQSETLASELAQREAERVRLFRTGDDLKRRLSAMKNDLERIQGERAAIAPSAHEDARLSAAQETLDATQLAIAALEAETVSAEEARQEAEAKERTARDAAQAAERALGILAAEAEAISRLLQIERFDLWPPMIDAIKVQPGFEIALGAAIGDDLAAPADEAAPVHWHTLPPIEEAPPLPAGIRTLLEVVEAPEALGRRLSQIGLVDSVEQGCALQAQLKGGQRLVTKAGDLWRWDGLRASAEAPTAAAQRLEQRNRLYELQRQIPGASAAASEAVAAQRVARGQVEAAREAELVTRRRLRDAQNEASAARDTARTIERAIGQTASQLAGLEAAERRIRAEQASAEQDLANIETEIAGFGDESERRTLLASAKDAAHNERIALGEAQAALNSVEREAAHAGERLGRIAAEKADWERRAQSACAQAETLERRIREASEERASLDDIPSRIEEQRHGLLTALATAEAERARAADALALAEGELGATSKQLHDAEEKLSEFRELRARLEAQREAGSERASEVANQIRDTLGCAPEDVFAETGLKPGEEAPALEAVDARLDRYRRERENLGGVNLRADEEAREAQERLDGLVTEKADLEGAIHKLRSGIASLNREGRERILAAFGTVNAHFERLFTSLFQGGTAKLELIESDDPLEAGLEIFARPPGKRLTALSLLSGGEQALTALSLIFAVFLSNPAPICVLDEVDAPLDDANVERFCNLLGEVSSTTETRFMVITHHPITMSRMDRLYGVTMAERGVSQLVSVDLTAASALRAAG